MSCFPCSQVSQSEQDIIKYYRNLYQTKGIISYVYRLHKNDGLKITKNFQNIYDTEIQPNLKHGAEYFRIDEFI